MRNKHQQTQEYIQKQNNKKEGNVLFNNALNTFYLRLYGIRNMVKDCSDNDSEALNHK